MTDYEPKRRAETPRGRRIAKRVLVVICTLVLVVSGFGIYLYKHFEGNISTLDVTKSLGKRPTKVGTTGAKGPMNVLVMGSDTRKGKGNHVAGVTPGLSDTTILLHLSKDRSRAFGVSIPRDSMVERPSCKRKDGHGVDPGGVTQFNAAYAIGGPACTIRTVEKITGVYIDHFVVIDFNGFKQMVDALGGVQICVPEEVNDSHGNIHLAAGTYKVTGQQALDYVRVRNDISANGDIGRIKRQQTFIAAMIKKVVSAGTLTNPVKLVRFLDAATKSLTTDPGFAHLKELASLGSSLKSIGLNRIQFVTAPFEAYPPDPNRVQLSPDAAALWKTIRNDRPLGSAYTSQVISASDKTPGTKGGDSALAKATQASQVAVYAGTLTLKDNIAQTPEDRKQLAADNGLCA